MGAFAVTAGLGAEELARSFEREHDDYHAIMVKSLADRLAEAFAEYLHQQARREWGYGESEQLANNDLIAEKYRGIRPAFGYPACPDHSEKRKLFALLVINPEIVERDGVQTEQEGCLSLPGFEAPVERPLRAVVRGLDRDGAPQQIEGSSLLARVFQHEIDHLDGSLFLDRLRGLKRELIVRRIKKLRRSGKW